MNRLLIIDGHNLLFQMFFGMLTKIMGAKGCSIHGVIGFVGAVNKLVRLYGPTHLLIMFDGEKENPRKNILKEYKANRIDYSEMPDDENPFTQLPIIYEALDYMGVMHTETADCETDDVIAAYAIKHGMDSEVLISSFDSDYFQLINDNVKVIRYRGESSTICDVEYIKKKYGVSPTLYLDLKCLVGDTSDNIPGIRGVGPKIAAKLINEIGNIEELIVNSEKISNEKIRTAIENGKDILKRNISLIKLGDHATLPYTLDELELNTSLPRTMDVIHGIGH